MMIDARYAFSLQLQDGEYYDLNERKQLTIDQPDINHPHVGSWGQLLHHTESDIVQSKTREGFI